MLKTLYASITISIRWIHIHNVGIIVNTRWVRLCYVGIVVFKNYFISVY